MFKDMYSPLLSPVQLPVNQQQQNRHKLPEDNKRRLYNMW